MKTTNPESTAVHAIALRASILAAAASLFLTPCLLAQTPAPGAEDAPVSLPAPKGEEANPAAEKEARLYSISFDGGPMQELCNQIRETFPLDNVVVDEFDRQMVLPPFELRSVRTAEIGRTLEFLTRGDYKVEIVSNEPIGNIWRIGPAKKSAQAAPVKMRSVAAPSLFSDEEMLADIQESVEKMEMRRLDMVGKEGGILRETRLMPLRSQKIFVIIGDEDGVAGLESLIKSSEQRASEAAAAKAAEFAAPRIRAVLAPHVFADEQRLKPLMDSLQDMESSLRKMRADIQRVTGSDSVPVPWAQAEPRVESKVFLLSGTEEGIASMENLVQAAEKIAVEEDAIRMMAEARKRAEVETPAAE